VELWEELYTNSFGGDRWGVKALQVMLATLGHYQGPIDDVLGQQTRRAVKDFQEGPLGSGLAVDAEPGKQTRHRLFLNYMDAICVDENNQPFRLELTEFLGGGIDSGGKGDYQGCGEFNPILMVSREENKSFKTASGKSRRNSENQPNRRVVIFFFRPGLRMRPEHWPCPRASEGTAGCRQRFFSDSDRRRSFQETRREFAINQDTFACRFYHHRIARLSPCEVVLAKNLRVIIHNGFGEPRKRVKAEVIFSDGTTSTAVTDDSGLLVAQTNASHETAHIQYQNFDEDAESVHSGDFFIDVKGVDTDEGVRRRLHNLGYLIGDDLRGALETFQITHGLDTTGEVDPATREKLSAVHDGGDALTPEFDFGERSLGPDELIEEGPTLSQGE
jgi:peptidoglycan hydrolase-like protein with peptidoglycan-binding domain